MAEPVEANHISRNQQAFAAWAGCYDAQPSPLLMLEERYLKKVLPGIAGRDVLDAGCGSGRWLGHLASHHPTSLKGIDASEEMLRVAAEKGTAAQLFTGSCAETPFPNEDFDLILSSFVLSYVEDLSRMAAEMSRIARDGCELFISDMHPKTERLLGWKRSFTDDHSEIVLDTQQHDLGEIIHVFSETGWTLRAVFEPEFGDPEREVFAMTDRLKRFHEAAGSPAIYILHLQKARPDTESAERFD